MKSKPYLLVIIVVCVELVLKMWRSQAITVSLPSNVTVPAVIVFGDSIVDTGNNNNNVKSLARSNFPPYGQDFPSGEPTGRYSNGKVPSDFIVEAFGLKDLLPPYSDPNLTPEDLLTGVCFAVGAVGYDPLTAELASVPSLNDQLDKFEEYKGKLMAIVGEERRNFIISNSMILVVLSSNDIANTYFTSRVRSFHYDFPSYANLMVDGASQFLQALYAMGGRRIAVLGAPPLGCIPSQRTLGGGLQRDCVERENELSKLFNSKLAAEIDRIQKPDARIIYVDIYYPLLDVIQRPAKYGFKVATKGCCGTGLIEAAMLCNPFVKTCEDHNNYVFWDAYHPTERVYKILIDQIIQKYQSKFV